MAWFGWGQSSAPAPLAAALRPLGALLILVAAVAAVIGFTSEIMLSLIVGPSAGLCLLIFGTAIAGYRARKALTT